MKAKRFLHSADEYISYGRNDNCVQDGAYKMKIVKIEEIGYKKIIECLISGGIIVYPTDTAYAFGCDATNNTACEKIFKIKGRQKNKILSLICADQEMAQEWLEFSEKAIELAKEYWHGPLGLVLPVKKEGLSSCVIEDKCVAIRVPDNIIARTISRELGVPICATSANTSGKGACYSIEDVLASLESSVNDVEFGIDAGILSKGDLSTIVKVNNNAIEVIRDGVIKIK